MKIVENQIYIGDKPHQVSAEVVDLLSRIGIVPISEGDEEGDISEPFFLTVVLLGIFNELKLERSHRTVRQLSDDQRRLVESELGRVTQRQVPEKKVAVDHTLGSAEELGQLSNVHLVLLMLPDHLQDVNASTWKTRKYYVLDVLKPAPIQPVVIELTHNIVVQLTNRAGVNYSGPISADPRSPRQYDLMSINSLAKMTSSQLASKNGIGVGLIGHSRDIIQSAVSAYFHDDDT